MVFRNMIKALLPFLRAFAGIAAVVSVTANAANLTDFEALSLSGDRTQIVLTFDGPVANPVGYSIEDPARVSLDFSGVSSLLAEKYIQVGSGNTRSAAILESGGRTRIVFSLTKLVAYATEIEGNIVSVYIGDGAETLVGRASGNNSSVTEVNSVVSSPAATISNSGANEVSNVDFRRTESGAGQVVVEFARDGANASVFEEGGDIVIRVEGYEVPPELRRKLDVVDFATAVHYISVYNEDNDALIRLDVNGAFDYLAYQSDRSMTLEVNQLTQAEAEERLREKFPYNGQKLSLNFQDIEIRDVLQIIANYVGFNLVASDSVSGTITLKLDDVPWDQALDLVLQTNGLDKRQNGNVLMVAPTAELAEQDRLALEARDQAEKLAPLRTEYVQINYAKAADIATIINSAERVTGASEQLNDNGQATDVNYETTGNGFLSSRGNVTVDARTNTLIITDTSANLNGIRRAIEIFDVPVRQVLIEARIVTARTSVGEGLGIRWGGAFASNSGIYGSGSIESNTEVSDVYQEDSDGATITYPNALAVDLPLAANSGSVAVGFVSQLFNLDLELTALETTGQAEVISQPKVITSDGQPASIFSGQNVAILGELVEAGLKLDVTPQITPDDRVVLNLQVNQDSLSAATSGPVAIDSNTVSTQVLVENGATLVLGGVFRVEKTSSVQKTPILGDLPVIGNMFRRSVTNDEKSELLIFITPKLVEGGLVSN